MGTGNLIQIQFSLYQVILVFKKMHMEVFQNCEIHCPTKEIWKWNAERISDMSGFARLLNSRLISYEIQYPDTVIFRFSNGCELILNDNHSGFEIFVIHIGSKTIVV